MTTQPKERSLSEVFRLLDELYGERNKKHLSELQHLQFLLNAVGTFGKMIRREEKDKWKLARSCSSIFSRGRAYVLLFGKVETIHGLSKKFPRDVCAYCNKMPCKCNEDRDRAVGIRLADVNPQQMSQTITEWCLEIDKTYGTGNRQRGLSKAFDRLLEEVVEVSDVKFVESQKPDATDSVIEEKLTLESADMFAWIFAIVAMLGIIPEFVHIIEARYCGNCHSCGKRPCECGPVNLSKERSYATPTTPITPISVSEKPTDEPSSATRHQWDRDN